MPDTYAQAELGDSAYSFSGGLLHDHKGGHLQEKPSPLAGRLVFLCPTLTLKQSLATALILSVADYCMIIRGGISKKKLRP
jgi:hypothetical protein